MRLADIHYPGHTEILADFSGTKDFAMMLMNADLRVILVTIHVSLREAIEQVTLEGELRTIRLADQAMTHLGIEKPRIAVAGLNPHAGEHGLFGSEDATIIEPAIQQAQAEGIEVSGPWPGDTVFMNARKGQFDIVVAQYHDQGLIPVKYLGVDEGVNITVGLPFIRTSVDHGTAFDIAGTGKASHASLRVAVEQAAMLSRQIKSAS
jgi:4-hydroxythreonine-4-phosphate dehydrogenase